MERGCTVHKLVADIALFSGRRVLLVKYRDVARYDGQRGWFLPDDFLVHEEHPQDAAKRIAREQTGVELEDARSEEHTSELQSRVELVCRLLLEKTKHKM